MAVCGARGDKCLVTRSANALICGPHLIHVSRLLNGNIAAERNRIGLGPVLGQVWSLYWAGCRVRSWEIAKAHVSFQSILPLCIYFLFLIPVCKSGMCKLKIMFPGQFLYEIHFSLNFGGVRKFSKALCLSLLLRRPTQHISLLERYWRSCSRKACPQNSVF